MEHADRAGHTALTKKLPEFISSSVCPEMLAGRLLACGIIGVATYEEARNTHSVESRRRGDLLLTVMGCGRRGAFKDFVHILLEMQACEWLGKKLIAAYYEEGGVWTEKVDHTSDAPGAMFHPHYMSPAPGYPSPPYVPLMPAYMALPHTPGSLSPPYSPPQPMAAISPPPGSLSPPWSPPQHTSGDSALKPGGTPAEESKTFTIDDLQDILELLVDVSRWLPLGLALGLKKPTLDKIEQDKKDIENCKMEMLTQWLNCVDNTKPSPVSLEAALKKKTVWLEKIADHVHERYMK